MMNVHALIGLGFLGFVSNHFAVVAPISIGAATGAPTSGDFTFAAAHSPSAERRAPEALEGATFPNFKPSEFPFVMTMPDDGTGPAGGYQEAKVNLEFTRYALPYTVIT